MKQQLRRMNADDARPGGAELRRTRADAFAGIAARTAARRALREGAAFRFPWRLAGRAAIASTVTLCSALFLIWPAAQTWLVVRDESLAEGGMSRFVPVWFEDLAPRFESWADAYLASGGGTNAAADDVAATEWPMFGSVFFLCAAADLHREKLIDATREPFKSALAKARGIVTAPGTAAWVRTIWGADYLRRENVFYRMLLILGLSAHEEAGGDAARRRQMSMQRRALDAEFSLSPLGILDDYPGECWPTDVMWAYAALKRAARVDGSGGSGSATNFISNLGSVLSVNGHPAFKIETDGMNRLRLMEPRGSGYSGMLNMAAEVDAAAAARWFAKYEEAFWERGAWVCGFHETARGSDITVSDVDSGPVINGFGSVASAFGIGAARSNGRHDIARPLVLEAVAASWSTPFGFMVPRFMGRVAMGGDPLGEAALLFTMSRPCRAAAAVRADAYVPRSVWCAIVFYALTGILAIFVEVRSIFRTARRRPAR